MKMREVKYVTQGFFGGQNSNAPGLVKDGWFHGFFQEGNIEGGIDPVAIVETQTGECIDIGCRQIKFTNQPCEEVRELIS